MPVFQIIIFFRPRLATSPRQRDRTAASQRQVPQGQNVGRNGNVNHIHPSPSGRNVGRKQYMHLLPPSRQGRNMKGRRPPMYRLFSDDSLAPRKP
jgi:hypothetical protein